MAFLRSKYSNLKGFVILDEDARYEIDFPLMTQIISDTSVRDFLSLPDEQKKQVLDKLSPEAKQALLKGHPGAATNVRASLCSHPMP